MLAINKTAPHPAAARLWEELMFSEKNGKLAADLTAADLALPGSQLFALVMGGQNVYISGGASPITSASMSDKASPPTALIVPAGLPKSVLPSLAQQNVATATLKTAWPKI